MYWKPWRPSTVCPVRPWSASMTWTRSRGQPRATAPSARAYWRAVDSLCSATCWGLDWRLGAMALRSRRWSRTVAERAASKWAGRRAGPAGEAGVGRAGLGSAALIAGLLPYRGGEALGDDLAERL